VKKIDLHIHTIPTFSDSPFVFSLDTFRRYVDTMALDAVAITNHDVFDGAQYRLIRDALQIPVFPGIEINVENGHLLLFTTDEDVDDFQSRADAVSRSIRSPGDSLTLAELLKIYGALNRYLVIPHYEKGPPITGSALEQLLPYVSAGEVDSAKKFLRVVKDPAKLTPVLFSDARMKAELSSLPVRQTYIDCGDLTLSALRACLRDRTKVALSSSAGNQLWPVLESGLQLSTGLNVILGARSSGKTHTLNLIDESLEGAKYIKQFALVQQDDKTCEREFTNAIDRQRGTTADQYLAGLKRVLDSVMTINLAGNDQNVARYLETLVKSARETDRRDSYSSCKLYTEVEYSIGNQRVHEDLLKSVRQLIENVVFRPIIERHVDLRSLKNLYCELVEVLRRDALDNAKKEFVNRMVSDVKSGLRIRSAATQVEDVDLYAIAMDARRVQRFEEIVNFVRQPGVIHQENLQEFRIEVTRERLASGGELKTACGVSTSYASAYRHYDRPYAYLQELLSNEAIPKAILYKAFVKIHYRVLNKDGAAVSGGERSEFRLLQEIADAQNHEVLLIDEPESSFDNLFLNHGVNHLLKDIAQTMPVVVVTHNHTVGASIGADYLLYTAKETENGRPIYRIYAGYPTDKHLLSLDGKTIPCHDVLMDSLEAGAESYHARRQTYEAVKD
jgi:hypothetical protein